MDRIFKRSALIFIFIGLGCFKSSQNDISNLELDLLQQAGSYVERGQYEKAREFYLQFIDLKK